jgi:hypothetical protein
VPVTGRKPKPPGQAVNRAKPAHEWTEVPDVLHSGGPKLPTRTTLGLPMPAATKRWWAAVSTMPHCKLWTPSDWSFALDTALVAAQFHAGDLKQATELRNRERVLGTTVDFRRDLRIRYVPAAPEGPVDADVTRLADYRDL